MANVYRNYPSMDEKGEDIESQEAIPTFTWEQKRNIGICECLQAPCHSFEGTSPPA